MSGPGICQTVTVIWNPIHLVYGGTYRYVPVRTGTYAKQYIAVRTFGKFLHDGTYQYILVRTGTELFTKVRTSTYFCVSIAVHGSTWRYKAVHDKFYHGLWQYMTVHGSTSFILSRFMAVHGGTLQYMTGFAPGGPPADFGALLKASLHALSVAIASSHCMHKLVYSSFGSLARASLATVHFAS